MLGSEPLTPGVLKKQRGPGKEGPDSAMCGWAFHFSLGLREGAKGGEEITAVVEVNEEGAEHWHAQSRQETVGADGQRRGSEAKLQGLQWEDVSLHSPQRPAHLPLCKPGAGFPSLRGKVGCYSGLQSSRGHMPQPQPELQEIMRGEWEPSQPGELFLWHPAPSATLRF